MDRPAAPEDIYTEMEESDIQRFYHGVNVFVTGATGFMGQVLLEKLLRTCRSINKIYVLARAKKGKLIHERFEDIFGGELFRLVHKENPRFRHKLVYLEGDAALPDLGLSISDQERLQDVGVVFHVAATVRFDEKLRLAAAINVRGTRDLLRMARKMDQLKALVHVSTAYSNCPHKEIDEVFYDTPISGEKLLGLLDNLDDVQLEDFTPILQGEWPNTYAFTKAVAEDMLRLESKGLPVAMIRPSIVVGVANEPLCGWINNVYGATGVLAGAGVGLLRSLNCDKNIYAEIVPVDMAISAAIAIAWETDVNRKAVFDEMIPAEDRFQSPAIYNYVSTTQNSITWGEFMKYSSDLGMSIPSPKCLWYYCFTLNRYRWVHNVYVTFLHLLPALIFDTVAIIIGRKPMLWKAYKKIHKFTDVIAYFSVQQWKFHNDNVQKLCEALSPRDKLLFQFDIASLDWKTACENNVKGVRMYILNDPLDTISAGRAHYRRLKIAHYTLTTVITGVAVWMLWLLARKILQWLTVNPPLVSQLIL